MDGEFCGCICSLRLFVLLFFNQQERKKLMDCFPHDLDVDKFLSSLHYDEWNGTRQRERSYFGLSPVLEQAICDTCAWGSSLVTFPWDLKCLFIQWGTLIWFVSLPVRVICISPVRCSEWWATVTLNHFLFVCFHTYYLPLILFVFCTAVKQISFYSVHAV